MLKSKRGITTLLQEELIKLIIVVLLAAMLLWFVYASAKGEISQSVTKSREIAIWMDTAYNTEFDSDVLLYFPYQDGISIKEDSVEVKIGNAPAGKISRIIPTEYKKVVSEKEVAGTLEIEVV
ncbi:MAG: hypothetical protein KJ767_03600 [Nanoarchaeota archaeon]|nr:hypothetical protein [Nanoarchaeota archaeon]